jgi:hypothetical protein
MRIEDDPDLKEQVLKRNRQIQEVQKYMEEQHDLDKTFKKGYLGPHEVTRSPNIAPSLMGIWGKLQKD